MNSTQNPLLPLVLHFLREAPEGCSEYELLKRVEAGSDAFANVSDEHQLALFQKHFLLMNALYRLQAMLWEDERFWLHISPLRIVLGGASPSAAEATDLAEGSEHVLRDYYLDWRNFTDADSDAVAELLAGFWQRYSAQDQQQRALQLLELPVEADWPAIKQRYRRLAAQAHPDRGGDSIRFLEIREAYEILRACRANH
jgi:DnaJ-domain-containing protein 1